MVYEVAQICTFRNCSIVMQFKKDPRETPKDLSVLYLYLYFLRVYPVKIISVEIKRQFFFLRDLLHVLRCIIKVFCDVISALYIFST